jgi:inner membrane protein
MNISFGTERRSVTIKVLVIAFLILLLAIPLSMVKGIVLDRSSIESDAKHNIQESWGREQTIAGPILKLPFTSRAVASDGTDYTVDHVAILLAEEITSTADVTAKTLRRGIHEVPVYAADLQIQANFDLDVLAELGVKRDDINWAEAEVLLGVSDLAAVSSIPVLKSEWSSSGFGGSEHQIGGLPPQLSANPGLPAQTVFEERRIAVELQLSLNGTSSLQFAPLAENAVVYVSSNWSSPSFSGRRLPAERNVNADGFTASWVASSLGRKFPGQWVDHAVRPEHDEIGFFGVRFMQGVGLYQLMFRALKYAVLFIGLTFVTYFLMETIGSIRLHPLQYLLVGFSNSLFYLLLLSLAEHVGFGRAYVLSSLASAALVIAYSRTVLDSGMRAMAMSLVLAGLYAFLYLTLTAEKYALLAGSVGLWLILAAIMYLTRAVNWHADEPVAGTD